MAKTLTPAAGRTRLQIGRKALFTRLEISLESVKELQQRLTAQNEELRRNLRREERARRKSDKLTAHFGWLRSFMKHVYGADSLRAVVDTITAQCFHTVGAHSGSVICNQDGTGDRSQEFSCAPEHCITVLPLFGIRNQRPLGTLHFCFEDKRSLDKEKRQILRTLARVCSEALERAWLFDQAAAGRQKAEEALRQRDELIATVAHELRSPITPILGYAKVLRRRPESTDEQRIGLDIIYRNAAMLNRLIEDLVDTSRITLKKIKLQLRTVFLQDVISDAAEVVREAAQSKNVRLEFNYPNYVPPVVVDPCRMQQVVWNLLSNAVKFTPCGGHVQVSVLDFENTIECHVQDNGIGIAPGFLPHVFDRFQQADTSATTSAGLGLGLYIVRRLVELHGGCIAAYSKGPNLGATFVLQLPCNSKP
jgi:signal transduction histidine kinase